MKNPRPPRLATALLRLVVPARDRRYLADDLHEEFEDLLARGVPLSRARRWYRRQVLASILPSLRRPRRDHRERSDQAFQGTGAVLRDLRFTFRTIRKRPVFHAVAIVTLAIGIGATSAMFSLVNTVVLRPLPYEDPERLVSVWHRAPGWGFESLNQTWGTFFTYRDENRVFEDIGLWDEIRVTVTGHGEPEQLRAVGVNGPTLDLTGVEPALGRPFVLEDFLPEATRTVILDHGYWERALGSDPDVVGKTLVVNGSPSEIVGVMPRRFRFLGIQSALFVPIRVTPAMVSGVQAFGVQSVARMRRGVSIEQANADVERMIPLATARFPSGLSIARLDELGFGANIRPLKEEVVGDAGELLWALLGSAGVLLVIAGANVANLFLARAEGRRREIAVRRALGAGRGSLVRQLLIEGCSVGLIGGAAGAAIAWIAIHLARAWAPQGLPRVEELQTDVATAAVAAAVGLTAGVLFGLFPLLRLKSLDVVSSLKDGGGPREAGPSRRRLTELLVAAQLAMALVLLVGAGLMLRSVGALLAVDPGFGSPEDLLVFRTTVLPTEAPTDAETAATLEQILDQIERVPGVVSAAIASSVTMDRWDDNSGIAVQAFPVAPDGLVKPRQVKWISEGYFETMQNPLLAGRSITWADVHSRNRVAVVTEDFAGEYWDDPSSAVGQMISDRRTGPWYEIVGVVGTVHDDGLHREPTPIVYWPLVRSDRAGDVDTPRSVGIAVRSRRVGDPRFIREVGRATWSVNPNVPMANVFTGDALLASWMTRTNFALTLLLAASALAVLLGVVGVYGVVSYMVAIRTREIGVRMALGASAGRVGGMVLRRGTMLGLVGIGAGTVTAFLLTRALAALLYGVSPLDPPTYLVVSALLLAVAAFASWLPARRAARLDPVRALAAE